MTNAKKKGNRAENMFANLLKDRGLKAWKDASSGGGNREKGDIGNNLDMTIEVKDQKIIKLPEWWRQTEAAASMQKNMPVLIIHRHGTSIYDSLVVMNIEDWCEMVKHNLDLNSNAAFDNPRNKYHIQQLVEHAKKIIKMFEDEV